MLLMFCGVLHGCIGLIDLDAESECDFSLRCEDEAVQLFRRS